MKKFEPNVALFLDDNIYDEWFFSFFKQVELALKKGGVFFMEGHENHLDRLSELAGVLSFQKIRITKDLSNRDRFLSFEKA